MKLSMRMKTPRARAREALMRTGENLKHLPPRGKRGGGVVGIDFDGLVDFGLGPS